MKKSKGMDCTTARDISILTTLARLGHFPDRESQREAWYLSPFRKETQASFKVNKRLNRWYDHGEGVGGNIIDLVCRIRSCPVRETLIWLEGGEPVFFTPHIWVPKEENSSIRILEVKPLCHPALVQYLGQRNIPEALAADFVEEVHFSINNRRYFALGLKNGRRGWELRNKYQKYCASPKAVTHLRYGHKKLCVVEGMFDLLSLVKLDPKWARKTDILILNSLALIGRSKEILSRYKRLELALDNDSAGDRATRELLGEFPNARDRRGSYGGYKDLNDKITADTDAV